MFVHITLTQKVMAVPDQRFRGRAEVEDRRFSRLFLRTLRFRACCPVQVGVAVKTAETMDLPEAAAPPFSSVTGDATGLSDASGC